MNCSTGIHDWKFIESKKETDTIDNLLVYRYWMIYKCDICDKYNRKIVRDWAPFEADILNNEDNKKNKK